MSPAQLLNALRLAGTELMRNKVRSLLTALGILIGVGAVIAMVNLGRGATRSIEQDLSGMGANLVMASPGADGGPQSRVAARPFGQRDVAALEAQVPHLAALAPQATAMGTVYADGEEWPTTVYGSTRDWPEVRTWAVAEGRIFDEGEERAGAPVCVVGQTVAEELLGERPVGAEIRIDSVQCEVIGVLEVQGENTFGMDQDDLVLAPLRMVQRRLLGSEDINSILLSVDGEQNTDEALAVADEVLRQTRNISGDETVDFTLRDTREMASMVSGITGVMTTFVAAVAGVSLLVGGIGIMNIMLVSVTERTREIGIRLAIGALETDVMTQFLVEAALLAALGGVLGVMLGLVATLVGSALLGVPLVIDGAIIGLALVFSTLMGVGFGWMPARRAARLEVVEALRHG